MEQFLADKTRVLLRPHWLSKSPNTPQKIAPVAVVFSGVNGLLSWCQSRSRGYDGDAAFKNAYWAKESGEFSSLRTGIEKQRVVNCLRTQRFFPSSDGVLYTHNAQGREWGGDIWEKEGDSSRQGDFSPIYCPQERKTLPFREHQGLSTPVAPNWK